MLSLNINKGDDSVDLSKLGKILNKHEIPPHLKLWILNSLSFRVLLISSDMIEFHGGLLQISCLSPVLFNLYAAKLHQLQDSSTHFFQYADDFLLIS